MPVFCKDCKHCKRDIFACQCLAYDKVPDPFSGELLHRTCYQVNRNCECKKYEPEASGGIVPPCEPEPKKVRCTDCARLSPDQRMCLRPLLVTRLTDSVTALRECRDYITCRRCMGCEHYSSTNSLCYEFKATGQLIRFPETETKCEEFKRRTPASPPLKFVRCSECSHYNDMEEQCYLVPGVTEPGKPRVCSQYELRVPPSNQWVRCADCEKCTFDGICTDASCLAPHTSLNVRTILFRSSCRAFKPQRIPHPTVKCIECMKYCAEDRRCYAEAGASFEPKEPGTPKPCAKFKRK